MFNLSDFLSYSRLPVVYGRCFVSMGSLVYFPLKRGGDEIDSEVPGCAGSTYSKICKRTCAVSAMNRAVTEVKAFFEIRALFSQAYPRMTS